MARVDQAHPDDVEGNWFVDTRCVRCDAARHWAPGLIQMDGEGRSFLARQPQTDAEEASLWRAAVACPTRSIGKRETARSPTGVFPYELTSGVFALGHNAPSSFGGHSYLAVRPSGNLLVDSPRFTRSLTDQVDELGGIAHVLLSHRDDIADSERWADRYGSRVWIHAADADAAPFATDITTGDQSVTDGVVSIHTPGHTEGHVAYHVDDRLLFTGDTLFWNQHRQELDVTPKQTWFSWDALADSMDRVADLAVEWIFAGHGKWHDVGAERYAEQMTRLGPQMRASGQDGWARKPNTLFSWY